MLNDQFLWQALFSEFRGSILCPSSWRQICILRQFLFQTGRWDVAAVWQTEDGMAARLARVREMEASGELPGIDR